MSSERFRRVEDLFHEALARPATEREAWLVGQCPDDAELRAEVARLVAAAADPLLTDPGATGADLAGEPVRLAPIGPYRILEELGHGGMGAVYLAVKEGEGFEQRVAIKLIRSGLGGELVRQRVLDERHILAGLDHPGIARLLDGGTTPDGQPYIVLEHVQGQHLTEFCAAHELSVAARVRLLVKVCEAVQYAHQRLVVHRDLKPSNILVTAEGQPKLLDFGIAKLLNPDSGGGPGPVTSLRWMTPDYASPEQVRGEAATTASDVYALGVLLYEVLAGRRPYRLSTGTLPELEQAILTQGPARPSTAPEAARRRRLLRGDLDRVVLKALEKEPARRYATAAELADDLRRHLAGLPVRAQPGTFGYVAWKFARRHRLAVAAGSVAVLSLLAGTGVALRQAQRARQAAAEAEHHRLLAERRFQDVRHLANTFLFDFHDALADVAGATEARALVLRRGVEFLDKLAGESGSNVELQGELAQSYLRLAVIQGATIYDANVASAGAAEASLARAVELATRTRAARPRELRYGVTLVSALRAEGTFHVRRGHPVRAGACLERAVGIAEELFAQWPQDLEVRAQLIDALIMRGVYFHMRAPLEQVVGHYRRALDLARSGSPAWRADPRSRLAEEQCLEWLATAAGHRERWEEALAWAQEHARLNAQRVPADEPNLKLRQLAGTDQHNLGWALLGLGRPPEAKARFDLAVAAKLRLLAESPSDVARDSDLARTLEVRADVEAALGRPAAALRDQERALFAREAALAREPSSPVMRSRVAWLLRRHAEVSLAARLGRPGALARLRRALDLLDQNLAQDPQAAFDRLNRARILSTLAREQHAAELHSRAFQAWKALSEEGLLPPSEAGRVAAEERELAALVAG